MVKLKGSLIQQFLASNVKTLFFSDVTKSPTQQRRQRIWTLTTATASSRPKHQNQGKALLLIFALE